MLLRVAQVLKNKAPPRLKESDIFMKTIKKTLAVIITALLIFSMIIAFSETVYGDGYQPGTYTVSVSCSGGSGRASLSSSGTLYIYDDGYMEVTVSWIKTNGNSGATQFEWMSVGGATYYPDHGQTFTVPVYALDTWIGISALTTAMSEPHEVDYSMYISSSGIPWAADVEPEPDPEPDPDPEEEQQTSTQTQTSTSTSTSTQPQSQSQSQSEVTPPPSGEQSKPASEQSSGLAPLATTSSGEQHSNSSVQGSSVQGNENTENPNSSASTGLNADDQKQNEEVNSEEPSKEDAQEKEEKEDDSDKKNKVEEDDKKEEKEKDEESTEKSEEKEPPEEGGAQEKTSSGNGIIIAGAIVVLAVIAGVGVYFLKLKK